MALTIEQVQAALRDQGAAAQRGENATPTNPSSDPSPPTSDVRPVYADFLNSPDGTTLVRDRAAPTGYKSSPLGGSGVSEARVGELINAAIAGKQDALTAATDAELAAVQAALQSGKQDAATAATDAELAAALASVSATITGLDARYIAALGQFELQPLWVSGHSWMASDLYATPGTRWWQRMASRLRSGTQTLKGVSGVTSQTLAYNTLAGPNAWTPRTKALVALMATINDPFFNGSAGATQLLAAYRHAWRSILSAVTANAFVASNTTQFVYSPGWTREVVSGATTTNTGQSATGGDRWKTTTVGAYFDVSFTGPDVDVVLIARAAGAGLATATIGGQTVGTLDLTAPVAQETPGVLKIRGQGAGSKTVRVTLTSGASLTVDSIRIPSTAPAPILVLGEPAGLDWSDVTSIADPNAFVEQTLKPALAAVCADFPTVTYLDLTAGFDAATMRYNQRHLNDKGCSFVASRAIAALASAAYLPGLNFVGDGTAASPNGAQPYPGAYASPTAPSTPSGGNAGNYIALPITDSFNRADADTLSDPAAPSWQTDGEGTGGSASSSVWGVRSNQLALVSTPGTLAHVFVDAGTGDAAVQATVTVPGTLATRNGGLIVRRANTGNLYFLDLHNTTSDGKYVLRKRRTSDGAATGTRTTTTLGTAASAVCTAGDVVRVVAVGTSIKVYLNGGATPIIDVTDTDALLQTATRHGVILANTSTDVRLDDFSIAAAS